MVLLKKAINSLYIDKKPIKKIYKGNIQLYPNNFPIEPDQENEYFYFAINNPAETAKVGFERKTDEYHPSTATTIPSINYSSFTSYVAPVFEYSYDKVTWNNYILGTQLKIGHGGVGNKVYFRGDNLAPWYDEYTQTTDRTDSSYTDTHYFRVNTRAIINNAQVQCNGNIMSLRYKNYQNQLTIPCDYAFSFLFAGCNNLLRGPILAATTLTAYCYTRLFAGCELLSSTPTLPATTMKEGCYASMFLNCAITTPPSLPATTLANGCYGVMTSFNGGNTLLKGYINRTDTYSLDPGMFGGCTALLTPPVLPATTLAFRCYEGMFRGCTSLATAPALPATTLADYCYGSQFYGGAGSGMFQGCTALTEPPNLPATTLAKGCYAGMFSGCKNLTKAPSLPATTLTDSCYVAMFQYCTSLTEPPTLSATTLASSCYTGMFAYSAITSTPKLPATTVAGGCYGGWLSVGMFQGCHNLTKITTLPALTISANAYYSMFADSNVKASATQTAECQYAYRVPTSGSGTADSKSLTDMFTDASNTANNFTPSVNTTFYINVPSF